MEPGAGLAPAASPCASAMVLPPNCSVARALLYQVVSFVVAHIPRGWLPAMEGWVIFAGPLERWHGLVRSGRTMIAGTAVAAAAAAAASGPLLAAPSVARHFNP